MQGFGVQAQVLELTHRLHSSSFFYGLYLGSYKPKYGSPKKELLWSLWVFVGVRIRGTLEEIDPLNRVRSKRARSRV